jgi:aminoglycoside phosphotransferase (APT) family kinase protein
VTSLEERLARAFPELRVAPLRMLARGFHSVAVETADGVVFRIPRQEGTANGHATEYRVLPVLAARLPAPIPRPEWRIEPGHPDFPFGVIGYRRLPGHTPETGSERLAFDLAACLGALHAFPLEEAEALGLEAWLEPRQAFLRHRDRILPRLRELLRPDEHARVVAWWDSVLASRELERFEPALRHEDPWFGNLLVADEGSLVAVIDWEGIEIGDPAADITALTYVGRQFVDLVLDRYRPVDTRLRGRAELLAQLREFGGVRIALELGGEEKLAQSVARLRAGPILSG